MTGLTEEQKQELTDRWNEPHREYHDYKHLTAVLEALDDLAAGGRWFNRRVVELAAWFHDAVYVIGAEDNEEKSAQLAEKMLRDDPEAAEVARLVRMTADHKVATGDENAAALSDADLAVLASSPVDYFVYVAAVRSEYAVVPDDAFAAGRSKIIRDLLSRERLFHTEAGYGLYEERARKNLHSELNLYSFPDRIADEEIAGIRDIVRVLEHFDEKTRKRMVEYIIDRYGH